MITDVSRLRLHLCTIITSTASTQIVGKGAEPRVRRLTRDIRAKFQSRRQLRSLREMLTLSISSPQRLRNRHKSPIWSTREIETDDLLPDAGPRRAFFHLGGPNNCINHYLQLKANFGRTKVNYSMSSTAAHECRGREAAADPVGGRRFWWVGHGGEAGRILPLAAKVGLCVEDPHTSPGGCLAGG